MVPNRRSRCSDDRDCAAKPLSRKNRKPPHDLDQVRLLVERADGRRGGEDGQPGGDGPEEHVDPEQVVALARCDHRCLHGCPGQSGVLDDERESDDRGHHREVAVVGRAHQAGQHDDGGHLDHHPHRLAGERHHATSGGLAPQGASRRLFLPLDAGLGHRPPPAVARSRLRRFEGFLGRPLGDRGQHGMFDAGQILLRPKHGVSELPPSGRRHARGRPASRRRPRWSRPCSRRRIRSPRKCSATLGAGVGASSAGTDPPSDARISTCSRSLTVMAVCWYSLRSSASCSASVRSPQGRKRPAEHVGELLRPDLVLAYLGCADDLQSGRRGEPGDGVDPPVAGPRPRPAHTDHQPVPWSPGISPEDRLAKCDVGRELAPADGHDASRIAPPHVLREGAHPAVHPHRGPDVSRAKARGGSTTTPPLARTVAANRR